MTETFIGGVMSLLLSRGVFFGPRGGYGLYFTTERLIGVDPGAHGGSELLGTVAGYIDGELMPTLAEEESSRVIAQLDQVKDFDLPKDSIRQIELKKPGSHGVGFGRINIVPVSGSSRSLKLLGPIVYDQLLQLTNAFSSQLVRTKPFLSL
jgi:hypothetical protein